MGMKGSERMNTNIVDIQHVSKCYHNFHALDDVSLQIKQGAIYGLIGRNGAGKSTLMKCMCGLSNASAGDIQLFGHELHEDRFLSRRIGVLIENAGIYTNLSAYENLKIKSLAMGCFDETTLQELLQLCGLSDAKKKKVGKFSMGMKQRLGIALALLGNPEFLILDEPLNGLDPQGILYMRNLLLKLNQERGITMVISSHILGELAKIATHYGILKDGKLIESLSNEQLLKQCQDYMEIKVDNVDKAVVCLEKELLIKQYEVLPDNTLHIYDELDASVYAQVLLQHDIKNMRWACMNKI